MAFWIWINITASFHNFDWIWLLVIILHFPSLLWVLYGLMKEIHADGTISLSSSVVKGHLRNILVLLLFMKAGRDGCKIRMIQIKMTGGCVAHTEHTLINTDVTLCCSYLKVSVKAESYWFVSFPWNKVLFFWVRVLFFCFGFM